VETLIECKDLTIYEDVSVLLSRPSTSWILVDSLVADPSSCEEEVVGPESPSDDDSVVIDGAVFPIFDIPCGSLSIIVSTRSEADAPLSILRTGMSTESSLSNHVRKSTPTNESTPRSTNGVLSDNGSFGERKREARNLLVSDSERRARQSYCH
jgi:hypothetical protein